MRLKLIALGIFISALLSFALPASGITFGREVTNGATSYPSVVSIWEAETAGDDAYPVCTGTLITNRIVLTAAHCIDSSGLYFVQYGADQLFDDVDLLPVSATWKNPRFSSRQLVNDTGLLLLEDAIPGAITTRLPSTAEIKSIQANKSVKYEIVGWGKDQNEEPATYLRKATVDDQTKFMQKARWWRNDVWFAVGKWNKKEKVFAGACNGDSGGPLFATAGSKKILAGITSWGAEDCETAQPSTYVRLSYYVNEINNIGIPTLLTNEVKQNRSLPTVKSEPFISGVATPDSLITCNQGTWSDNTQSVSITWSGPGLAFGTTSPSIKLSKVAVESKYVCEVTGRNSNGTTTRKVTITQLAPPQAVKSPSIQGVPSGDNYTGSNSVTCTPATFTGGTSSQIFWWIGLSYSSPDNNIGTGTTLVLTKEIISKYGGGYLYCQTVASGPGGNAQSTASVYLPTWSKPAVKLFWAPVVTSQRTASGSIAGDVLSCSKAIWTKQPDSETYSIYIKTGASGNKVLSNSATYVLTSDVITNYQNYEIHCSVTGTNAGGTVEITSSSGYRIQPAIRPDAPRNFGGNIGTSSVALSWIAPANNGVGITDYVIERASGGSSWIVINDGVSSSVSFTDTGLTPGTRYEYRVRAFNGTAYSDYSSTISAGIPLSPTPTPAPIPTDAIKPVIIVGSGIVEKSTVKFNEDFTFTFRVTDNVGVASTGGIIYRPDDFPVAQGGYSSLITGTAIDGVYRVTLSIPTTVNNGGTQNNPIGTYKISAWAQDAAQNASYVSGSYYTYIGTIEVTG